MFCWAGRMKSFKDWIFALSNSMASSRPLLGSDPYFRQPEEQDNHCMISLFLPPILCYNDCGIGVDLLPLLLNLFLCSVTISSLCHSRFSLVISKRQFTWSTLIWSMFIAL